jgi:3-isopropylmalate/(R)-2-methylmalate dehydratase large subunit
MGATITEKILARKAGVPVVKPGESRSFKPDYMMAYDFPGYTDAMFRQMKDSFGIDKVAEPHRYVLFIDHMTHEPTEKEQRYHDVTRDWAAYQGVALHEGQGIGHQLAAELGYALPGTFSIHFDAHISGLGAFGALGIGVRRDLLEAWVTGEIWIDVPATTRFELLGEMSHGVDSRDLIHKIIGDLGPASCRQQVMEYTGPGARAMSIGRRQSLCGMAMFTGALSAIFNPDEQSLDYAGRVANGRDFQPVSSDADAEFANVHQYDLNRLEPQIVLPGSPRYTTDFQDVVGTPVSVGYIGSCVSGRIEDLRAAAEVLKGRHVAAGFELRIIPTSQRIFDQARREGLIDTLEQAGAYIAGPSCDFCFGHARKLAEGQKAISTGVLNIPGRMGSTKAEIYMASAYTIAATALGGRIADPREHVHELETV